MKVLSSEFSVLRKPSSHQSHWEPRTVLLRQFISSEKETQFEARRLIRVGAVDRIVLNAAGPFLADGALFGIGRIGGAHQLAPIGNGGFLFQRQSHDRST